MKGPVRNPSTYQFNAAGKTLTFLAPIPTFQGQILGVFNITRQTWIYLPQKVGANGVSYTGTWSSPTLALAFDTTAHSNTDSLQVFYDDGLTAQAVAPDVEVGGGAITAKTQRFTLATDDLIAAALGSDGINPPTLPGDSTGIRGWLRYLAGLLPALNAGQVPVTGTFWQATQPISAVSMPLPAGAAIAALQPTLGTAGSPSADVLTVQGIANGNPLPVVASPNAPIASSYQQTTPGPLAANTILIGPINCANTRMLTLQAIAMGTGGNITPEWSFDSSFSTGVVTAQMSNVANGVISTGFSAGNFSIPVLQPWFRLRLSTATTGGITHVQLQQWSETVFTPTVQTILPVIGSVIGATPFASVTDVSSSSINASITSPAITPAGGLSHAIEIPVSSISGANAWMDARIEESGDSATTWYTIYDFPRITANGQYRTPKLAFGGTRWRYIQTLNTGTSLTRSIVRNSFNDSIAAIRQRYDRTISLTTQLSVTPALIVGNCRNLQMVLRADAVGTTAPVVQMQGTEDDWQAASALWYNIGAPLTGNATNPVSDTVPNVNTQAIRGIVTTAGAGGPTTLNYVLLKGF
jgi:hypothetical protein